MLTARFIVSTTSYHVGYNEQAKDSIDNRAIWMRKTHGILH